MSFPAGLRALNHRDFRLFWTGQAISVVGSWMQSVGQAWLVLELTDSPFKLGVVSALQFGPLLFLSVVAGVVTDRFPKRWLIIGTQVALMLLALTLATLSWTGHVQYWHVALLAGAIGVVNALDMPARQSFISELVARDDVVNAVALNAATFNAARAVGPAVAGLLIGRFGVAIAFLLNGLSFLAVLAALLALRVAPQPRAPRHTTVREEIADGLRYAFSTPLVVLILSLMLVVSVFVINHTVMVPLLAREVLHQGVSGFGFLMSALGVGALLGAAALAGLGHERPPLAAVVTPAIVVAVAVLCLSVVRAFWLAAAVVFVVGAAQIVFLAGCNTTLQITTPDRLRGRVMSLYTMVFAGMTPIGSFLVGSIAEAFGIQAAYAVGGGLGLACLLALTLRAMRTRQVTWS